MYVRKTVDRWDIETNWGYGWEVECCEYTREKAKQRYREYWDNRCGRYEVRITKHREKRAEIDWSQLEPWCQANSKALEE